MIKRINTCACPPRPPVQFKYMHLNCPICLGYLSTARCWKFLQCMSQQCCARVVGHFTCVAGSGFPCQLLIWLPLFKLFALVFPLTLLIMIGFPIISSSSPTTNYYNKYCAHIIIVYVFFSTYMFCIVILFARVDWSQLCSIVSKASLRLRMTQPFHLSNFPFYLSTGSSLSAVSTVMHDAF